MNEITEGEDTTTKKIFDYFFTIYDPKPMCIDGVISGTETLPIYDLGYNND